MRYINYFCGIQVFIYAIAPMSFGFRLWIFWRRIRLITVFTKTFALASILAIVTLSLHDPDDGQSSSDVNFTLPQDVETIHEDGWIRYGVRNDDGQDFGALARTEMKQNTMVIAIKLFVKEERHAAWARLETELAAIEMNYDTLLAPHTAEHGRLFHRAGFDLEAGNDALA